MPRAASFTTGVESTSPSSLLDAAALRRLLSWLAATHPAVVPPRTSSLTCRAFSHGQSNPTFLVGCVDATGAPTRDAFVLRKKPHGVLLASAHDVAREHAVLVALSTRAGRHAVPVAAPLALCTDDSVLGTPFYLMSHIVGRVFTDPALPELQPAHRAEVYAAYAKTLATLHAVDVDASGLAASLGGGGSGSGSGGGKGYAQRQTARWAAQYDASCSAAAPPPPERVAMEAVAEWLRAHAPPAPPRKLSLVHGDYRLDNLVFHPSRTDTVLAVLDWELAALGDAAADVGFACLPYHLPRSDAFPTLPSPLPPGVPDEASLVAACAPGGADMSVKSTNMFWVVLALFRLASILAGVRARAAAGNAAAPDAAAAGGGATALAMRAALLSLGETYFPTPPSGLVPPSVAPLLARLEAFISARVIPAEAIFAAHASSDDRWSIHPLTETLKAHAKAAGLWNLWLPADSAALVRGGPTWDAFVAVESSGGRDGAAPRAEAATLLGRGLTNAEYAHCAEAMGASPWAPEIFNCSAPDTGNMEILIRYGSAEQQKRWLLPLLTGATRSCFAMTEPAVGSSDATNICSTISRHASNNDVLVLHGTKWWISGACDPRCSLAIFMGRSASSPPIPAHKRQSMVLVPMPSRGLTVVRPLTVFGYDDAPHGHAEITFNHVEVPAAEALLGGEEGRGFEIAQARRAFCVCV